MGNEIEIVTSTVVQQSDNAVSSNDIIKLPEGTRIDTKSEEFFAVAVEVLPDNIKNEVKDLAEKQRVKYSLFEIFLFAFITVTIFAAAIYWLLPAKPEVIEITGEVTGKKSIVPPVSLQSLKNSPEALLLKKMLENYKAHRYRECLELLKEDKITEILNDKEKLSKNAFSLNYFLNAIQNVNLPYEEKKPYIKQAVKLCRQLTELNSDSPAWHLHRLYFENYDIVANDSFEKIPVGKKHKNGTELDRLQQQVKYLENLKNTKWENDLCIKFDLLKSKIYIACWLHFLSYDNSHIYKENNSNGFREREAAWKTINQYSENNLEFLKLKEFILRKIKRFYKWNSGYEINNIKFYRAKHLDEMLEEVAETRKILNKAIQEKGL